MKFTIYYEAKQEALWFRSLSKALSNASMEVIKSYGKNLSVVDDLIAYDSPDIILLQDGVPRLVLEKTEEVPTGHNVGQRFARLVRAAELKVASVYFLPFARMKHGLHANPCWINIRLLEAMLKMWEIHGVPALAIEWPHDENYELVLGGTENEVVGRLIDTLISANFNFAKVTIIDELKAKMKQEINNATLRHRGYGEPPNSVKIILTESLVNSLHEQFRNVNLPEYLTEREKSLVYYIRMSEKACRREDPYTGMQLVYDYHLCRKGPTKNDRHTNLVLHFPNIRKNTWLKKNPFDLMKKRRLWYIVPDLLVFKDGVLNPEIIITKQSLSSWIGGSFA
jgi:hypothetical protein